MQWFRNSKTTHPNGLEPLIFYHKSRSNKNFNSFKHNVLKNPYNKDWGFYFVLNHHKHFIEYIADGVDIYAYLRIEKPFIIHDDGNNKIIDMEGVYHKNITISKTYCENLIERGFDSIIIYCYKYYNQYIVFNPEQIKSVNNSGSFHDNDNILE